MQKVTVVWLVVLLAMSLIGQVLAQTQQTITVGDIVNNPDRWDNRRVTLVGEIRNPVEAAEVRRGTYGLRDERGNTITVRTAALPGADQMQGKFQELLDAGLVNNRAAIARLYGLSRARVTHVMNLLDLPDEIQEYLIALPPREQRLHSGRRLQGVVGIRDEVTRAKAFEELVKKVSETAEA